MRFNVTWDASTADDARLVELSRAGQREAFGLLVARYQSPVCAFAYGACGNLAQSEDLAQETFIIAWRKLGDLQEPAKFKGWLYGIARNLINSAFRAQTRNPLAGAEELEESLDVPAGAATPAGQAMSREEERILWRSLEEIPEAYREPLILFYREQQSIERVAAILDLSEEAVRQRLSRGRKMLQERVVAFVEGALARTAPGNPFTLGVMSVLPGLTTATSGPVIGSAALKGGAAGKAAAAWGLGAVLAGLLIKVLPPVAATWAMIKLPESKPGRQIARKGWAILWAYIILFYALVNAGVYYGAKTHYWHTHPRTVLAGQLVVTFGFIAPLLFLFRWWALKQAPIRKAEMEEAARNPNSTSWYKPYEYRSKRTLLGLPLVHVRYNCVKDGKTLPAIGWIALGSTKAYGILFASGAIAVGGITFAPLSIGLLAWGGFGIGLLAFGGLALGFAAMGGGSVGYMAYGGGAIGWLGAGGGVTWARHYALGGSAVAEHANDHAAWLFMHHNLFFRHVENVTGVMILLSWLMPVGMGVHAMVRRQRQARAAKLAQTGSL
jgi:RNA polymerase sigma factor (sigma-70 family)